MYHPAQLSTHVISAISLARFIGDLFTFGLLTQAHVMNCISKIMETTFSEEHVVALGYLVQRSGPKLWMAFESLDRKPDFTKAGNFLCQYEELMSRVTCTLVSGGREPGYSAVWIDTVRASFAEWEAYFAEASLHQQGDRESKAKGRSPSIHS